jgi:hypothetical protein
MYLHILKRRPYPNNFSSRAMLVVISMMKTQRSQLFALCVCLPLIVSVVPGIVCIVATLVVVLILPLVLETASVPTVIQGHRQHAVKRSVRNRSGIIIVVWGEKNHPQVFFWQFQVCRCTHKYLSSAVVSLRVRCNAGA